MIQSKAEIDVIASCILYATISAMNPQPPIPDPHMPPSPKANIRFIDLLLTGLIYLIGVTLAYFLIIRFDQENAVGMSQGAGSILAVCAATWLYQSKNDELAPTRVKATVGLVLAISCVVQGLLFQQVLKWMTYPDISIVLGAIGGFIFPFILWNNFGKSVIQSRKPRGS